MPVEHTTKTKTDFIRVEITPPGKNGTPPWVQLFIQDGRADTPGQETTAGSMYLPRDPAQAAQAIGQALIDHCSQVADGWCDAD